MSEKIPIGEVLKAMREHLGLTQAELGDKLGWTRQRIGNLESGNFHPSLVTLFRIASFTGIPASRILRNVEKRLPPL